MPHRFAMNDFLKPFFWMYSLMVAYRVVCFVPFMSTNLQLSAVHVNRIFSLMTQKAVSCCVDMTLAERLRSAIEARGVKQSWLAAEAGIPEETLSRIVTGVTANPKVETLAKIARVLGETVSALIGEPGYHVPESDRKMLDALHTLERTDRESIVRHVLWCVEKLTAAYGRKIAQPVNDTARGDNGNGLEDTSR